MMKKAMLTSLFSAFIIILIIILLFTIACIYVRLDQEKYKEFSVGKWENHPGKRWLMIDDFEAKYPIDTLTRETIKELLGENGLIENEIGLTYTAGRPSWSIYTAYYRLTLDEKGSCFGTYVYYD